MRIVMLALVLLGITNGDLLAQKKKEIRKNKIKAMTIYSTDQTGKEFKEIYTVYDANGNILEDAEYKNDGSLLRKEINKYDRNNEQVEHIVYEGSLVKKKVNSSYNATGDKVTEVDYDDKGNLLRKNVYTYDKRGLKTEKKVFDAKGNVISIKKYNYQF